MAKGRPMRRRTRKGRVLVFLPSGYLEIPKVGDYLVRNRRIWKLKVNVRIQDINLDLDSFGPLE
jgi:hypothetical protein